MQTGRVKELDRMPEQLREARRHRDTIEQVVLNQLAEVKEKESLVLEMQTAADQAGYGSPLHDVRKFLSLQSTLTEIVCRHRTERNKIVLPSMLRFLATARGLFLSKFHQHVWECLTSVKHFLSHRKSVDRRCCVAKSIDMACDRMLWAVRQ